MTVKNLGIIAIIELLVIIALSWAMYSSNDKINKRESDILRSEGMVDVIGQELRAEQAKNDSLSKLPARIDTIIKTEQKYITQIIHVYEKDSTLISILDADQSIGLLSKFLSQKDSSKW